MVQEEGEDHEVVVEVQLGQEDLQEEVPHLVPLEVDRQEEEAEAGEATAVLSDLLEDPQDVVVNEISVETVVAAEDHGELEMAMLSKLEDVVAMEVAAVDLASSSNR